jgi:hypothetical protein
MLQTKRDNTKITGTGGGQEVKYNKMNFLLIDIFGKDNFSLEDLDSDNCFQAEETVVGQQQALLRTSVLLADTPSPSFVRDENRSMYLGLRHTIHVTH